MSIVLVLLPKRNSRTAVCVAVSLHTSIRNVSGESQNMTGVEIVLMRSNITHFVTLLLLLLYKWWMMRVFGLAHGVYY